MASPPVCAARWGRYKRAEPAPEPAARASSAEAPTLPLPRLRRLRLCGLAGELALQPGVGLWEASAAELAGLTADWPKEADPVLEFATDGGRAEAVWTELLQESPAGDRWGIGPLGAHAERERICFDRCSVMSPFSHRAQEENASLCAGSQDLGFSGSRPFGEWLTRAGLDVDRLKQVHKDVALEAELKPRELVHLSRPCKGLLASVARFSPELQDLAGTGVAILDVFDEGHRPARNARNVALVYVPTPGGVGGGLFKGHSTTSFLCGLWDVGCHIARLCREYNWLAAGAARSSFGRERAKWRATDLRARIEFFMSKRNLATETNVAQQLAHGGPDGGWVDFAIVKSCAAFMLLSMSDPSELEVAEALQFSRMLEAKATDSGIFIRQSRGPGPVAAVAAADDGGVKRDGEPFEAGAAKRPCGLDGAGAGASAGPGAGAGTGATAAASPAPKASPPVDPKAAAAAAAAEALAKAAAEDLICWNFVRGFCAKGTWCNYVHPGVSKGNAEAVSAPRAFNVGSRVLIQGLVSKPELNDRVGECEDYDMETARWQVRLGSGVRLRVKESNLTRC